MTVGEYQQQDYKTFVVMHLKHCENVVIWFGLATIVVRFPKRLQSGLQ